MRRILVLIAACLLWAVPAAAQTPTFDFASSAGSASASTVTVSHTIGAGGTNRYLACAVSTQSTTRSATSVVFNGTESLTKLTELNNADDTNRQSRVEYWYRLAPSVITADVVVTLNAATAVSVGCVSYADVDQSTPHGTPVTAKGDGATISVDVASASGEVVLDAASVRVGTTNITAGGGQTERINIRSADGIGNTTLGMSSENGASTTTMSWTVADTTAKAWTTVGVPLKGAAFTPPTGNQLTVCASGCAFDNTQLQSALNAANCGDEVLLEWGITYSRAGSFVMGQRCTTGTWDRITIRTGVGATGSILSSAFFPPEGVRMPAVTYRAVLAKLIPAVNNEPAIRTVWPAETGNGCVSAPCVGDGWTLKWLEFGPKSDWLKGRLVLFGSNKSAGDTETAFAHDAQDTLAEVPQYLTLTQCDLHGDPYAGQHGGLYLSSKDARITHNSFTDFKSLSETQAITEVNGVGPFLIENNLVEATGENLMFGGSDTKLQQSATITGTPTTSSITMSATTELFSGQYITVTHAGIEYSGIICTLTGSTCAIASPHGTVLPVTPSAGDVVKWQRLAGGATIRLNAFTKPASWRDNIVPTPTGVSVTCSNTGGSLTAATYAYRVAGVRFMGGDGNATSAAAAQVSGTVTLGNTGSCRVDFVESEANTGGTYVYGRTSGAQNTRWLVPDGTTFYVDTGSAGSAVAPSNNGSTWVVKNAFELKHLDGLSPAGPGLIEGNVIGPSWCCSQNMIASMKANNQSGGEGGATVRGVTFRKNWLRHGVRCLNLSTAGADNLPTGAMTDMVIEDNLCTDLSTTWGGDYTGIQVIGGNYPNHVGPRAGKNIVISHNTLLQDVAMAGPFWFVTNQSTDEMLDFVFRDNIAPRQGSSALRTYINQQGQTVGTTSWNLATTGSSSAVNNVWPDASSGTYSFSTSSFFPTDAALKASLVSYAACKLDIITGCALNGTSTYDAAGSDGLDIGADIAAIKTLTDIALSGDTRQGSSHSGGTRSRIRLKLGGGS